MRARTRNEDCLCRLLADDHCSFSFGGLPGELEITFRPLSKAVQQWQLVPAGPVDLKQLVYSTQAGLVSRHTMAAVNDKRQGEMEDENQPMNSSQRFATFQYSTVVLCWSWQPPCVDHLLLDATQLSNVHSLAQTLLLALMGCFKVCCGVF